VDLGKFLNGSRHGRILQRMQPFLRGSSRSDELAYVYCLHRRWPITSIISGSVTQISHSSK